MSEAGYRMYEKDEKREKPLAFKCDVNELKQWLQKRSASLKKVRLEFEPLWKKIRLYFEPNLGKALLDGADRNQAASEREDDKILNSEPRLAAHRYAAGMQSGITNQAQQWFQFVPRTNEDDVTERPDLKRWFSEATRHVSRAMQRGNIYQTTDQVYLHSGVMGTSVCLLLRGDGPGEVFLHLLDEGDYWIAENRFQMVTTLMRRMDMSLGQLAEEFLFANLTENLKEKIREGQLEDRITVWNLICPNDGSERFKDVGKDMPFVSVYWIEGGGVTANGVGVESIRKDGSGSDILEITGFTYNPIIAYRHFYCGSVYGKGLGEMGLGDAKELQEVEEYILRLIAGEAEPAMIAPSSMKGKPINVYPGAVTYVDTLSPTGGQPIQRLFQTKESIEAVAAQGTRIEERIGKIFYSNLFAMLLNLNTTSQPMTASEVRARAEEKVTLLGPVLTRMDHEFLNALTDGIFEILRQDDLLGEIPDDVLYGNVEINTEYVSTIHADMQASLKLLGINKTLEIVGMVAQAIPTVVDKIDGDQVVDEVGMIYPSTAAFIRSDKDVLKIRSQREQQQQQQLQNQQMAEMAKTAGTQAKALAETPYGTSNALEALVGTGGRQ